MMSMKTYLMVSGLVAVLAVRFDEDVSDSKFPPDSLTMASELEHEGSEAAAAMIEQADKDDEIDIDQRLTDEEDQDYYYDYYEPDSTCTKPPSRFPTKSASGGRRRRRKDITLKTSKTMFLIGITGPSRFGRGRARPKGIHGKQGQVLARTGKEKKQELPDGGSGWLTCQTGFLKRITFKYQEIVAMRCAQAPGLYSQRFCASVCVNTNINLKNGKYAGCEHGMVLKGFFKDHNVKGLDGLTQMKCCTPGKDH